MNRHQLERTLKILSEEDPNRVWRMDQGEFDASAHWAVTQLNLIGFSHVALQPGDSTMYEFSIIRPPTDHEFWVHQVRPERHCVFGDRYFIASQFGTLYEWTGEIGDVSYVFEKFTTGKSACDPHTARVYFRFLNTLAVVMAERKLDDERDNPPTNQEQP